MPIAARHYMFRAMLRYALATLAVVSRADDVRLLFSPRRHAPLAYAAA